jgi:hypothetical protein
VQNVERWVLAPLRHQTFFSEAEANRAIRPLLDALNNRPMAHLGKSRRQLFEELDQPELRPLPEKPYEFATWKTAKVNIDYHIAFEKHFYSVPFIRSSTSRWRSGPASGWWRSSTKASRWRSIPAAESPGGSRPVPSICLPTTALSWNSNADWLLRQAQAVALKPSII